MAETQDILPGAQVRGVHRAAECRGIRQTEQEQGGRPVEIQANTAAETVRLAKRIRVEAMVVLGLPAAKELPSTEATMDALGIMGKAMTRESSAQVRLDQAAPVTMNMSLPEFLKTTTRIAMTQANTMQAKTCEPLTHLSTSTKQDMR